MNKISLLLIGSLSLNQLYGSSINLQNGWNLFGASDSYIDLKSTFENNQNIDFIWTFDNASKQWLVYGNTAQAKNIINGSNYNNYQTNYISPYNGFWINNNSNLTTTITYTETSSNIQETLNLLLSYSGNNLNVGEGFFVNMDLSSFEKPVTIKVYKNGEYDKHMMIYMDTYIYNSTGFSSDGYNTISFEATDGSKTITDSKTINVVNQYTNSGYQLNFPIIDIYLSDLANKTFKHPYYGTNFTFNSSGFGSVYIPNYSCHLDGSSATWDLQYENNSIKLLHNYGNSINQNYQTYKAIAKNENGLILYDISNLSNYMSNINHIASANATPNTFSPIFPITFYTPWGQVKTFNSDGRVNMTYLDESNDFYQNTLSSYTYTNGTLDINWSRDDASGDSGSLGNDKLKPRYQIGNFWIVEADYTNTYWMTNIMANGNNYNVANYTSWNSLFADTDNMISYSKYENGKVSYDNIEQATYTIDSTGTKLTVCDNCHDFCNEMELKNGRLYQTYRYTYNEIYSTTPIWTYTSESSLNKKINNNQLAEPRDEYFSKKFKTSIISY